MSFIFQPQFGSNQSVAAGAASASVPVATSANVVHVRNRDATNIAYIRFGNGPQTATVADFPVVAGQAVMLRKGDTDDTIAYISAAGAALEIMTGTIYTG